MTLYSLMNAAPRVDALWRLCETGHLFTLSQAFQWHASPHGNAHWAQISAGFLPMTDAEWRYLGELLDTAIRDGSDDDASAD